jgi:putative flippase GtrA
LKKKELILIENIKKTINKFYTNQFFRFLMVDGINTVFGYAIFVLFTFLKFNYFLTTFLQTFLGIIFNYKTIGIIVFKTKKNTLVIKFFLVYLILYLISNFVFILIKWLYFLFKLENNKFWLQIIRFFKESLSFIDWDKILLQFLVGTILVLPMAILGYFLNKKFVFTEKSKENK